MSEITNNGAVELSDDEMNVLSGGKAAFIIGTGTSAYFGSGKNV